MPVARASSNAVVSLGHSRWDIENKGFNETVTFWHGNHVYKHEAGAILVFWLLCMIACNLFHAFFKRNLKPVLRGRLTMLLVARLVLSELLSGLLKAPT